MSCGCLCTDISLDSVFMGSWYARDGPEGVVPALRLLEVVLTDVGRAGVGVTAPVG